jgi:hypothetical protein
VASLEGGQFSGAYEIWSDKRDGLIRMGLLHCIYEHHVLPEFTTVHNLILIQPTISLEMPVPSQGHYGFHSFPVVD